MTRSYPSSTLERCSGVVRLVRLAAAACLALAVVGSAAVWAQPVGVLNADNRSVQDEVQQRVLRSVAQDQHRGSHTLSAVGLTHVAAVPSTSAAERGTVDYGVADEISPRGARSEDWRELRITVSTEVLTNPAFNCTHPEQELTDHKYGPRFNCTADDILTENKRDILINSIIPEAVRLHTERLKVKQGQSNWTVTDMKDDICVDFKVPQAQLTNSVNNTDFLLYLTSVPSGAVALPWGAICQVFPDGRPAVGVINVPAAQIVSRYDQRVIRTVAHQIAHALGFGDRFFKRAGITKNVTDIREIYGNFTVINGSKTVEKAQEHYGCESLKHLEMENNSLVDWEQSHLSMRNAKDELMAPEVGAGYYSALTMAIFEDTGFYKADFSKAEVMTWGRNAGCDFFNSTCMNNGTTQWPQMFCNQTQPELRCTSSRLEIGGCGVYLPGIPSDEFYKKFLNTMLGRHSPYMDSCPYVEPEDDGACNQNSSTASGLFGEFSVFSDAARCIDGAFTTKNKSKDSRPISGMCANVQCDNATNTYSIQVKGSSAYVNCTEGQKITLDNISNAFDTSSYITCPPYVEVCQGNVKAAMDFNAALEKNRGTGNSSGRGNSSTDSMPSSGRGHTPTDSMSSSGRGHTPTDSMPSSGRGKTPADSMPNSGRGHAPTDSIPNSGRGHTPTDSMPSGGSGANKPDATSSNGKGDRLFPLGNGAAGVRSARILVSAEVALMVVTLTVGLSA